MNFLAGLGRRRLFSAFAALVIAFGAGHLMQSVLAENTPLAKVDDMPDAAPLLRSADGPLSFPTPPAATLVPLNPTPPIMPNRVDKPEPVSPQTWDDARMSPFGFDCTPNLTTAVLDAAMIEVVYFAPCDPSRPVTLRHGGLEIDLMTDPYGRAETIIPALSDLAILTVWNERATAQTTLSVPNAHAFSRVILVWEGEQVFRMNAYELGASRGQGGHIWAGSPKTPARAMRGTGGFLTFAGQGYGRAAEVYTFPTGFSPLRGVVELVVEAQVTEVNCGRMSAALALQTSPLGGMTETDVRVTLPDCAQIGAVLELKNLLQDMRLAGR